MFGKSNLSLIHGTVEEAALDNEPLNFNDRKEMAAFMADRIAGFGIAMVMLNTMMDIVKLLSDKV